jgi:hypothetical protein
VGWCEAKNTPLDRMTVWMPHDRHIVSDRPGWCDYEIGVEDDAGCRTAMAVHLDDAAGGSFYSGCKLVR